MKRPARLATETSICALIAAPPDAAPPDAALPEKAVAIVPARKRCE